MTKASDFLAAALTSGEAPPSDYDRPPAYEKMVAMWDGYGEKVTAPEEILPAIRRAAANGKPSIINVEVDNKSLSPFIEGYATMVAPSS